MISHTLPSTDQSPVKPLQWIGTTETLTPMTMNRVINNQPAKNKTAQKIIKTVSTGISPPMMKTMRQRNRLARITKLNTIDNWQLSIMTSHDWNLTSQKFDWNFWLVHIWYGSEILSNLMWSSSIRLHFNRNLVLVFTVHTQFLCFYHSSVETTKQYSFAVRCCSVAPTTTHRLMWIN